MNFNNGKSALDGIGNGFNMANMLKGATNGKNGGQRALNILPVIMSLL